MDLPALRKFAEVLMFTVFTDHRTLENFCSQKHLSWRQAWWQEFLSQYNFEVIYVHGEENSVADALSRLALHAPVVDGAVVTAVGALRAASHALRACPAPPAMCAASSHRLCISSDPKWLTTIQSGYADDMW